MDTIAAIATAMGEGGIGIVKVSGPRAFEAVNKIFRAKNKKQINQLPSHHLCYGKIVDAQDDIVDEVLIGVMKAPNTYTREDIVEINCHGGNQPLRRILELVIAHDGVRLADPGEFTQRAFLNGRIDLVQAESVIDIIKAQTNNALRVSMSQLQGRLSAKINHIIDQIIHIQAGIAVNVDYPEYEDEAQSQILLNQALQHVSESIADLLASSKTGRIMREGLNTVIIGRPNVGKSSLMNYLLGEERAIVTAIPGTTRDTVEEMLNLDGIPLRIIDTAGIRESDDPVERIGVERSRQAFSNADLVLLVLDSAEALSPEDRELIRLLPVERAIIIVNKIDLPARVTENELRDYGFPICHLSATEALGKSELAEIVKDLFLGGQLDSSNHVLVSNVRHIDLLQQAQDHLENAIQALIAGIPIDLVNIDVENTTICLGNIVGRAVEEDLLTHVFSQFCVGK